MLTKDEECFILSRAYIPEHGVALMTCLSGGEPFLLEGFFCCAGKDWVIVVGYPLGRDFRLQELEEVLGNIILRFRPAYLWVIAPELVNFHKESCDEREEDFYYTISLGVMKIKRDLQRTVEKAGEKLSVEQAHSMGRAHEDLSREFVRRANPPERIKELISKAPALVDRCEEIVVLNAWTQEGSLSAFYVVDLGPERFSTYVIGCHSKVHYVLGASDLLFHEMVKISEARGKEYIHLGLGVNEGIRRFKTKWGGSPTIPYRMCGLTFRRGLLSSLLAGMGFMK
ncbi:MAG: hypothetical protein AB1512_22875 [Thermodesulfobacteriota bacterium]